MDDLSDLGIDLPKGTDLPATHPSQEVLAYLSKRRSTLARLMTDPGPDDNQHHT